MARSSAQTPGIVYHQPAKNLTPRQIAAECYAQIKEHLNKADQPAMLTDAMLHSWFLDPAIRPVAGAGAQRVLNDTPLFIQHPGEWAERPDSRTAIPNLFLAGDWVRTNINVTTMEGANEAGRRAANALLDAAGSTASPAGLWSLYVPPEYESFRSIDRELYRQGRPNPWDPDQAAPSAR